jgi:glycosyltransferase involved in cell wall biosynthesis
MTFRDLDAGMIADVAVWGRIPPPIGGMAIHLQRLQPYLAKEGITIQMYSVGRCTPEHPAVRQVSDKRISWLFSLLFTECEPVHYVFSDNTYARFAASLLSRLKRAKVVLRIGGGDALSSSASSRNPLHRYMIRFAVHNADVVLGVNEHICNLARALGARRVIQIPGFIPADEYSCVPKTVESFLNQNNGPILLASGEIGDNQEDDLYGAYLLLELVQRMPHVRLLFYAYPITKSDDNQEVLANEIVRRGLEKRYLLFRSETDLVPVMRRCDVLVRPTLSDGDSNSVREALCLGLPVIASDCVKRPEGVVAFQCGNLLSLENKVKYVLSSLDSIRETVRCLPKTNNAETVVALLNELLARPRTNSSRH